MVRVFRRFFRPMSRPAALLLAWQHRKSLAMWARSIRDEARHARTTGRLDVARWKALLPELWRHRQAAERGIVRSLAVTDDRRVVVGDASAVVDSGIDVPAGTQVPLRAG